MSSKRLVIWFAVVLALALYSRWHASRTRSDRCGLDGNRIEPVYAVDLMLDGRVTGRFCCVRCASEWPDVPADAYWQVRDEITGRPLDATTACFVESSVVTVASRQDRTHVFASWADALGHMTRYDGIRVPNPLAIGVGSAPSSPPDDDQ